MDIEIYADRYEDLLEIYAEEAAAEDASEWEDELQGGYASEEFQQEYPW